MDIRKILFKVRGGTPIPFILVALIWAEVEPSGLFIGLMMSLFGEWLRIHSHRFIGGATRTRNLSVPKLIIDGPYAYVRNPLYLGNMLMYCGFALASNAWFPWLPLAVIVFFAFQYGMIISVEEETLVKLFGNSYDDYRNKVPMLFPRKFPWNLNATKPTFSFNTAVKQESRTLQAMILVWVLLFVRLILSV